MQWKYGVELRREGEANKLHVYVRDIPEVIMSGFTEAEALDLAKTGIEMAIEHFMREGKLLPVPSSVEPGEHTVGVSAHLAAKASIYTAWLESGLTKVELAAKMGRNESEIRRILDPKRGTKLDQLEEAAKALGGELAVEFVAA